MNHDSLIVCGDFNCHKEKSNDNAIISLIHQRGEKDKLKKKNISLTNTHYKIFAHILANRLQKVAKRIITRDSAYLKEKYIGENTRFILDIFEYYEKK